MQRKALKKENREELVKKTFAEHYSELRKRFFLGLISWVFCIAVCFGVSEEIYSFLASPLADAFAPDHNRKLIFTGLTEGFMTQFKLALYSGLALNLPFIIGQVYLFLEPGLYKKEKKVLLAYVVSSVTLFVLGFLMVYYFVIPAAWKFFLNFESFGQEQKLPIVLEARVSEYLDLTLELIIGFGIAFQLPIILIILIKIGLIDTKLLTKFRRHAIVVVFIVAALLTPPDVFSQITLALPLLLLYETSILIGKLIEKNHK